MPLTRGQKEEAVQPSNAAALGKGSLKMWSDPKLVIVLSALISLFIGAVFFLGPDTVVRGRRWYVKLVAEGSFLVRWSVPKFREWQENGITLVTTKKEHKWGEKAQRFFKKEEERPWIRSGALFISPNVPKNDPRIELVVGNTDMMHRIKLYRASIRTEMRVPNTPADIQQFLTPKDPRYAISVEQWPIVKTEDDAWAFLWGKDLGPALKKYLQETNQRYQ